MLTTASVTSSDLVYDLGCGDGRIVILAAQRFGAKGVGVDLDPARIEEAKANAKKAGVEERVQFFQQNLFDTDISKATAVMLYLWPEVNLRLRPKLLTDLTPGTRVVSHSHTMGEWKADSTRIAEKHDIYLFIIPANVTGAWKWTDKEGATATLHLKQRFQKVEGSIDWNGASRPMNMALRGDVLRFSVETTRGGKKAAFFFEGHVSGNSITGSVMGASNISPRSMDGDERPLYGCLHRRVALALSSQQVVEAPCAGPGEDQIEEEEAPLYGKLAAVEDGPWTPRRVGHEIGNGHLAG